MTNLVSRCRVRHPTVLASTASESPGNTKSESQKVPLSSLNVQQTGTGKPVSNKFVIDDDMDSDAAAESDLSLKSRSFLNRVNDRLRKMLNRSPEDSMQDIDKRSLISGMFVSSTLEAPVFMEKELLRQFTFHQKYKGKSHFTEDVRDIRTVDIGTIG